MLIKKIWIQQSTCMKLYSYVLMCLMTFYVLSIPGGFKMIYMYVLIKYFSVTKKILHH